MTERMTDGFIVRATTEPEETGADFYEPAFRIRKAGSDKEFTDPWFATSQLVESRTREEALEIAERDLLQIDRVTYYGENWDITFR